MAGNKSSSANLTVKRDASPPTAVLAVSAGTLGQNGWYTSDVTVQTTGTDALSGIAACSPDQVLTLDTTGTDFTGSCSDQAGNVRQQVVNYAVVYNFIGFERPLVNPPKLKRVSAGSRVRFRWRLTDANGQPVTSLSGARLDVEPLACPIARRAKPGAAANNGKTQFKNLGNGSYQLTWKTPKSYNSSCKTVKLVLNEGGGQERKALFQFSRQRRECELRPNGDVLCKLLDAIGAR